MMGAFVQRRLQGNSHALPNVSDGVNERSIAATHFNLDIALYGVSPQPNGTGSLAGGHRNKDEYGQ